MTISRRSTAPFRRRRGRPRSACYKPSVATVIVNAPRNGGAQTIRSNAMSDLTIYLGNKNYASWSLRAWLALKHSAVEFDEIVIPLYQPGSRQTVMQYSPSGRLPALRHGELTVWDSLAICEYLAEIFPDAGLWPGDPQARAAARAVSAEMHAGFGAMRQELPMNIRSSFPGRPLTSEAQADINRIMAIWRDCRSRFGE